LNLRIRLWDYLSQLRNLVKVPWLLVGDLNEVLFSSEVSGGNFHPTHACLLAQVMNNCNLIDLHTIGGIFTWRKNIQMGRHVRKRLDRTMVDVDWQLAFPHALTEILPQHDSDHNPLLINCSKFKSQRSKFFHFQAAWIAHPDYEKLVDSTWNASGPSTTAKLASIKEKSITFNKEVFGNIFKRKRQVEARIKGVQRQLGISSSSDIIRLERDLQKQFSAILEEEEILWFQKSRENWIKFGNKNTKFYHTQTVIRRRRNKITSLKIDGIWCSDDETLKREASNFFKKLFQSNAQCDPHSLLLHNIPQIPQALHDTLLQPVSKREVKDAIYSMSPYKAPGPDGFQPIFFTTYWHIVGGDVWKLVSDAFASGHIPVDLAETLIIPIPKIDEPQSLSDFRPISLCNVVLKLVSKVLVRRIRPHLETLIGPLQSSFIPIRGTADNALIAQEIVHHMHTKKGKSGFIMYKIDFEKAYDSVDWNFLKITLTEFGFPTSTIDLIMSCTTSSSLSLKWNNEKLENFAPTRGLRQGDPMSPYLFLLCMEKLALLIQEKIDSNKWLPIRISSNGPAISHLFFADDCLLFTRAKCNIPILINRKY
jgi:hypothetical protein